MGCHHQFDGIPVGRRVYHPFMYSAEIYVDFKWINYTTPYKDPLYTIVEMSKVGYIKIARNHTSFEGLSPWELRYPERLKQYVKPQIKERYLEFDFS